jgi:hypothetical protein
LRDMVAGSVIEERAQRELLAGFESSLARTDEEVRDDGYMTVGDGIRVKRDSGEVYVSGLVQKKTVIEPGEYKEVKSSALTIVKGRMRRGLPVGKWRQFRIGEAEEVVVGGKRMRVEG